MNKGVSDIDIYNISYEMALKIHKVTLGFPKIEQYGGMADQLRRSSRSIAANIVEGFGKNPYYKGEFKKMLVYAIGSCDETILWIKMSKDLGYIREKEANIYLREYQILVKKISSFTKNLRS